MPIQEDLTLLLPSVPVGWPEVSTIDSFFKDVRIIFRTNPATNIRVVFLEMSLCVYGYLVRTK